ncbi:MAG: hypothetical protein IJV27_05655, partial [Prevotella sp.]|nr:hypothetical protein [Prevotella sp.]
AAAAASGPAGQRAIRRQRSRRRMPSQGGRVTIVRWPVALACVGLGESLWLPGSPASRKVKSLSCVANESGSQRPRPVRRWLEPSLLSGALAERRGLDRFCIGDESP